MIKAYSEIIELIKESELYVYDIIRIIICRDMCWESINNRVIASVSMHRISLHIL